MRTRPKRLDYDDLPTLERRQNLFGSDNSTTTSTVNGSDSTSSTLKSTAWTCALVVIGVLVSIAILARLTVMRRRHRFLAAAAQHHDQDDEERTRPHRTTRRQEQMAIEQALVRAGLVPPPQDRHDRMNRHEDAEIEARRRESREQRAERRRRRREEREAERDLPAYTKEKGEGEQVLEKAADSDSDSEDDELHEPPAYPEQARTRH